MQLFLRTRPLQLWHRGLQGALGNGGPLWRCIGLTKCGKWNTWRRHFLETSQQKSLLKRSLLYIYTWGTGERKLGLQVFLRESANVQEEEEEEVVVVVVVVVVVISRRGSTLARGMGRQPWRMYDSTERERCRIGTLDPVQLRIDFQYTSPPPLPPPSAVIDISLLRAPPPRPPPNPRNFTVTVNTTTPTLLLKQIQLQLLQQLSWLEKSPSWLQSCVWILRYSEHRTHVWSQAKVHLESRPKLHGSRRSRHWNDAATVVTEKGARLKHTKSNQKCATNPSINMNNLNQDGKSKGTLHHVLCLPAQHIATITSENFCVSLSLGQASLSL